MWPSPLTNCQVFLFRYISCCTETVRPGLEGVSRRESLYVTLPRRLRRPGLSCAAVAVEGSGLAKAYPGASNTRCHVPAKKVLS